MTPHEIKTELDAIAKVAGPKSFVNLSIGTSYNKSGEFVSAVCYFDADMRHSIRVYANSFTGALAALRAEMDTELSKAHAATIRKMALAIMTITADVGACSDAALRGEGFSQSEIDMHGDKACEEATRIGSGGPFQIVRADIANAAE